MDVIENNSEGLQETQTGVSTRSSQRLSSGNSKGISETSENAKTSAPETISQSESAATASSPLGAISDFPVKVKRKKSRTRVIIMCTSSLATRYHNVKFKGKHPDDEAFLEYLLDLADGELEMDSEYSSEAGGAGFDNHGNDSLGDSAAPDQLSTPTITVYQVAVQPDRVDPPKKRSKRRSSPLPVSLPVSQFEFECKPCFMAFLSKAELTQHRRDIHRAKRGFYEDLLSSRYTYKEMKDLTEEELSKVIEEISDQALAKETAICYQCGEIFNDQPSFVKHLYNHEKDSRDVYYCTVCKENFVMLADKVQHEVETHGAEVLSYERSDKHKCLDCGQCFETTKGLKTHIERKCQPSNRKAKDELKDNVRFSYVMNAEPSKNYKKAFGCVQCATVAYDIDLLVEHMQTEHMIDILPACTICENEFESREHIKDHVPVLWICETCAWVCTAEIPLHYCRPEVRPTFGDGFNTRILKYDRVEYSCSVCPFNTDTYGGKANHYHPTLLMHLSTKHDKFNCDGEPKAKRAKKVYACPHCQQHGDFRWLKVHSWNCTGRIDPNMDTSLEGSNIANISIKDVDNQPCGLCGKILKNSKAYYSHMSNVHGAQKECNICGMLLKNAQRLYVHMRAHKGLLPYPRNDDKEWTCGICGLSGISTKKLDAHKQNHRERKFQCPACSRKFRSRQHLRLHQRIHTGEKACHCEHCGKGFSNPSNYKLHIMIHTGVKPFACAVCGQQFTNKRDTRKHVERTHCITSEEMHEGFIIASNPDTTANENVKMEIVV